MMIVSRPNGLHGDGEEQKTRRIMDHTLHRAFSAFEASFDMAYEPLLNV